MNLHLRILQVSMHVSLEKWAALTFALQNKMVFHLSTIVDKMHELSSPSHYAEGFAVNDLPKCRRT